MASRAGLDPPALPAFGVLAVTVFWAADGAGYAPTVWYPGALLVLGLVTVCSMTLPGWLRPVDRRTLVAAGLLGGYAAWSYLGIAFAQAKGDAWDGANRTLLYALVFVLIAAAGAAGRERVVAGLVIVWTLAIAALALATVLRLARSTDPGALLLDARLVAPSGYANAAAATWMQAFWPALVLAGRAELPPALRGLLAGGATLLGPLALLTQSRGAIIAAGIILVIAVAFMPGRVRFLAALVPVGAGLAVGVPRVQQAVAAIRGGADAPTVLAPLATPLVAAAIGVGVATALAARLEPELARRLDPQLRRRIGSALVGLGVALAAGGAITGLVAAGGPVHVVERAWTTFRQGYPADAHQRDRLAFGLGSNRFDFYRVALDTFTAHPLVGAGPDNFAQEYLAGGRSGETPRFPHSLELGALAETGLVGAALLLGFLAVAGRRAWRAARARTGLPGAIAAAAGLSFAYWLLQGSFDWFWELPALAASALAMLAAAGALAPAEPERARRRRPPGRWPRLALTVVAAGALLAPWLAEVSVRRAETTWPRDAGRALALTRLAARLDPLADRPLFVEGSIAVQLGELAVAQRSFAGALARDPTDGVAALELGAVESARGERHAALAQLGRAGRLMPRDAVTASALDAVRSGVEIDLRLLERQLAAEIPGAPAVTPRPPKTSPSRGTAASQAGARSPPRSR